MSDSNNKISETHHLFPSGDWEGFYTYLFGVTAGRHTMFFSLNFENGVVRGTGSDDVGPFKWKGGYDKETMRCQMTKVYAGHTVFYDGHVDENGIWGSWQMQFTKGGFHIWPKKNGQNTAIEEVEEVPVEVEVEIEEKIEVKK